MSTYVVVKPGTCEVIGENCSTDFEMMRREAVALGGVVTNTLYLRRKYNMADPAAKLKRVIVAESWGGREKTLQSQKVIRFQAGKERKRA